MTTTDFEVVPDDLRLLRPRNLNGRVVRVQPATAALLDGKTIRSKKSPPYFAKTVNAHGFKLRSYREHESGLYVLWTEKKEVNNAEG